ncbi:MAG: hypothetical protein AB1643_02590 [Patescibacteria group bacterium]
MKVKLFTKAFGKAVAKRFERFLDKIFHPDDLFSALYISAAVMLTILFYILMAIYGENSPFWFYFLLIPIFPYLYLGIYLLITATHDAFKWVFKKITDFCKEIASNYVVLLREESKKNLEKSPVALQIENLKEGLNFSLKQPEKEPVKILRIFKRERGDD